MDVCVKRAGARGGWVVRWYVVLSVAIVSCAAGCGAKTDVPAGDAAENIRKLALGYVQYAGANKGVGPADEDTLIQFISKRNGMTTEEAKKYLVSIRDSQPYVIRWGLHPMAPMTNPAESPKPNVIVFEKSGANGTRYIADGRLSVREVSGEEFSQLVPDHSSSGN